MTSIATRLPLYKDHRYRYAATLGQKKVTMKFYYNKRDKSWHMDVSEQEGVSLIQGLKLLPGVIHGFDFDLSFYGLDGYFLMTPVADNIAFEEIDPESLYQYYNLVYVEEQ